LDSWDFASTTWGRVYGKDRSAADVICGGGSDRGLQYSGRRGQARDAASFTGTGTHTIWLTPDVKCIVQGVYKNSVGAKTIYRLLSFKPG